LERIEGVDTRMESGLAHGNRPIMHEPFPVRRDGAAIAKGVADEVVGADHRVPLSRFSARASVDVPAHDEQSFMIIGSSPA
jgi:nitrate reductase beta subunit